MAGNIQTGLGKNVDIIANKSPTFIKMFVNAQTKWKNFSVKSGKDAGISGNVITISNKVKPDEQVFDLSHELGHLINRKEIIHCGSSKKDTVDRNVVREIQEEMKAVQTEYLVLKELQKTGKYLHPLNVEIIENSVPRQITIDEADVMDDNKLYKILRHSISAASSGDTIEDFYRFYYSHYYKLYQNHPCKAPRPQKQSSPASAPGTNPNTSLETSQTGILGVLGSVLRFFTGDARPIEPTRPLEINEYFTKIAGQRSEGLRINTTPKSNFLLQRQMAPDPLQEQARRMMGGSPQQYSFTSRQLTGPVKFKDG
ncbi:MAG: ImmA/IrrE family metallo-endopeptidase, partial [Methanoregula sp.]|nr:ImmA/IrrE family metallo-endopeptidase [Methanoregula sp.]